MALSHTFTSQEAEDIEVNIFEESNLSLASIRTNAAWTIVLLLWGIFSNSIMYPDSFSVLRSRISYATSHDNVPTHIYHV